LKTLLKFGVAVLLASVPAWAQQTQLQREGGAWVQMITGTLPPSRNLHLTAQVGSVEVHGSDQAAISYVIRKRSYTDSEAQARREFDAYRLTLRQSGDTAVIEGEWEGGGRRKFTADYSIQVPRTLALAKLETEGGNLSVRDLLGRVEAASGGGSINLDRIGGTARAETGGGTISVGSAEHDLHLETGGGSIRVASARGRLEASSGGGSIELENGLQDAMLTTGGGSIQVKQCQGHLKVSTGGGSINVGQVNGGADLETGGGSIRLSGARGMVRAETGGGAIELYGLAQGARAETGGGGITAQFVAGGPAFAPSSLETPTGDVTVYLAPALKLNLRAAIDVASGHTIHSDFPEIQVRSDGDEYGPRQVSAQGALNGGGALLKVHTTTGDIWIRRR
jgi:DUF4097 and DUF4098 domain-containing protein YvlB